jgi:hypothetical protein
MAACWKLSAESVTVSGQTQNWHPLMGASQTVDKVIWEADCTRDLLPFLLN